MKTSLLFILFLSISVVSHSQTSVPQGINYQAVVRNNVGTILTNTVVSFKFDIYNSSSLGTPIYSELHATISTGSAGVATCTIGGGIPSTGSLFSNINWAGGDVWYQTYLIINSTTYPVGFAQKFQTVPYAFYAGKAPSTFSLTGNSLYSVGGSTVTLPTSTGTSSATTPTITGNGLAVVTPTTGSVFAVTVPTPALSYNSSSQVLTLTQGSFVTSQTLSGTSTSTSVINILGTGIASVSPTSGTSYTVDVPAPTLTVIAGNLTLQQGTSTSSVSFPNGLWSQTVNNLFPNNVNSWIGIGTAAPMGKLDIVATGSLTSDLRISNVSSTTVGPNIYLQGANKSWSIIGTNGGASAGANKLVFRDYTMAQDRMVIDGAGNVGIGTVSPIHKLMVEENTTNNANAAIFGLNNAISGSNNAHGVFGSSNSTHALSAGVYGQNTGNGSAIFGNKTSGLSGSAGRFILQTPNSSYSDPAVYLEKTGVSSPSPALYAKTNGTGAAVYATTTNSLALEVNEGHIKSSQNIAPTVSITPAFTSVFSAFTTSCTNCSDVKGNITLFDPTTNTLTINYGDKISVRCYFNKPYSSSSIPIVNITLNSLAPCFYAYVSDVTNTYFEVTYMNVACNNYPISSNKFFKFNYFVIE